MRDTARRVIALGERPSIRDLDELTEAMRGHVQLLVPEIRNLITGKGLGDIPAQVAQICAEEAWRRFHTTRGFGPDAAYRHAQKLALSVFSLCDHHDNLREPTGPVER
ncbi:DUF6415 family natural product biosynthesis protein [Streptomyces sp. NPDC054841]